MDSRFEGLRNRLQDLQEQLLASQVAGDPKVRGTTSTTTVLKTTQRSITRQCKTYKLRENEAPQKKQPRFQTAINPSKSTLKISSATGDAATVGGLLARLREEENRNIAERAAMQLQLQKEKRRAQTAETAARRAEDQRDFRVGEVRHLKAALQRRDDVITSLQDQVRELEVGVACAEAVQLAEAERDEIKAALDDTRRQLEEATERLDTAQAQATEAQQRVFESQSKKERLVKRLQRALDDVSRLNEEIAEERQARAMLEQAVSTVAQQAAQRKARMSRLLALGERLPGFDDLSEENSEV